MAIVGADLCLHHSFPYRKRVPEAFSVITAINSLLRSLNPQNPKTHRNPDPAVLGKFSAYLTEDLVIQVIKNAKSPYHSLFFFNWASNPIRNPNNYRHSRFCYTAIAEKLLPHKIFLSPEDLLKDSKNTDFPASKLIKAYGDLKYLNWCVNLFRRERRNDGLCLLSFNSLLGVLVKDNKVSYAWGYFGNVVIKSSVLIPDVSTYTTMMGGLCKVGMVDYAEKLFDEMSDRDLFTYNTIVNGLCKNGLVERAQSIVDRMGGYDGCYPSVVTFNALIDGYCKKGHIDYAFKCFDEMVRKVRCEPDVLTYNTLINGLCLHGRVDEAKRMLSRMRRAGWKDDILTHRSFLNGYCIAERYYEAIVHFNEMIAFDVSMIPRLDHCNVVLKSLVKLRQLDKAIEFLNEIPQWGFRPNCMSYREVIMGLTAEGRIQDIDTIVDNMIQDHNYPDTELYTSLIEVHCVNGNVDKAIYLFEDMVADGYVMKRESFKGFVKELCSRGSVNQVKFLFDHMKKRCSGFDVVSYQSVMNEYISARDESSSTSSAVSVEAKTDRRFLAAKGAVPIGIGKNTHIKRAIIDKNARIGENVKIVNSDNVQEAARETDGYFIKSGIVTVIKDASIPSGTVI